ncbi:B12-binding domain-containing radical SAM protein [Dyadobacter aurulentus]|uniref:B12-binding domain-containing radical SAM protein n=1 Tax=Dyadobacter sp. UC 10 TaxID=2605428 RepID=UPI0011F3130E|nr:radical SAM protein [Dyadobacter sp. UC 10]KAA0991594.1 radical SAM protein [Dyadobacter sp. UC 10]
MQKKTLFVTPPFTQLNTPYPATAYLKGFLNTLGRESYQADLGIDVILELFSAKGLGELFRQLEDSDAELTENSFRIYSLRDEYISTIDPVIRFLKNKNPTLAHSICDRSYLPEASRFQQLEDMDWAFGTMGIHDKARHFATLYLEDLGDLIQEAIDPHFGFSRYAERLGRSATSFDEMEQVLEMPDTLLSQTLKDVLERKLQQYQPDIVCISVPFPGNLYGGFKCGQYLKQHYPAIKVVMGGGFPNTELRSLKESKVFNYIDFICLDDGEAPLMSLLDHLDGNREAGQMKRVYSRVNGEVIYHNGARERDIAQRDTGTPDYSDLPLNDYLSVIEIVNPMHRLWSDGRWNKLTLAHGCYWGKCTFCDISLDYIRRYEPMTAGLLCDRIEEIIAQTSQNGFHFVDEAAPPALLRDLALEIIRRKLTVVWWTNIRFEKNFTHDLCLLLKASGCIAISGGLEVASDRLLEKMKKGVNVAQVARVADAFTQAGIMVHAYLMYGFPTQTAQETIDSLEMVRQLFQAGIVQSGFWHRFAMTAHSPVGLHPEEFDVMRLGPDTGRFANNDLEHDDPLGAEHERFSEGLRKSLFNYMHGVCLDFQHSRWFDFKVPVTSIPPNYIERSISELPDVISRPNALVVWLGSLPEMGVFEEQRGKRIIEVAELVFFNKKKEWAIEADVAIGEWLVNIFSKLLISSSEPFYFDKFIKEFELAGLGNFEIFTQSKTWQDLRAGGLLVL